MILFPWLSKSLLLMSCQPPPVFTPMSTALIGTYVTSTACMTISTTAATTTGTPAVVAFSWRASHLCFVCIIKETRSKLMKRYRPKLLRRKQGTMSNLQLLLVSVAPQCWMLPRLITVIYIFLLCRPRQKCFRTGQQNYVGKYSISRRFLLVLLCIVPSSKIAIRMWQMSCKNQIITSAMHIVVFSDNFLTMGIIITLWPAGKMCNIDYYKHLYNLSKLKREQWL